MLSKSVKSCRSSRERNWARFVYHELTQRKQNVPPSTVKISRAFASAANAATKEGPDAKKEAKKSALQTLLSTVKVILLSVLPCLFCVGTYGSVFAFSLLWYNASDIIHGCCRLF